MMFEEIAPSAEASTGKNPNENKTILMAAFLGGDHRSRCFLDWKLAFGIRPRPRGCLSRDFSTKFVSGRFWTHNF